MSTYPLESQREGTRESEAAKDVVSVGWCVKCVQEGQKSGLERLMFGCDLEQLFLCGVLKKDPH